MAEVAIVGVVIVCEVVNVTVLPRKSVVVITIGSTPATPVVVVLATPLPLV